MKNFHLFDRTDQNKSMLFRFVTSYSLIIILILILGLFFLFSVRSSSKEYTYRQNYTLFEKSVQDMDMSFRLLGTLSTQIGSNASISSLSNLTEKTDRFYTLAKESMNYLTSIMALQDTLPIDSFFVYLSEMNYLISPTIFSDTDLYYRFERNFPAAQYNDWLSTIASYDNCHVLLPLSGYQPRLTSYLYKIPLSSFHSDTFHPGIACFELRLSDIRAVFDGVLTSPSAFIFVTDSEGNPVYSLDGDVPLKASFSELSTLVDEKNSYATEEFREGLKGYTITKIVSSYNNWEYYLVQPSSYLLNDLTFYQFLYISVILLFCILSYLLIYQLSKANVKPYEDMNDRLETSEKENLSLQETLNKQRPLVYSAYLARIMKGAVSNEQDIRKISEFLQIKGLGQLHFSVLYVSVRTEQLEHSAQNDLHDYEDLLYRSFYQYFGSDILIYHPDINSFALLLSSTHRMDSADYVKQLSDKFTLLHDALLQTHSLWLYGGIGDSNTKLPYFWKSYQQAMEAASYATEEPYFLAYRNLCRSNASYYYPIEMEQQLASFIECDNALQIEEIFKLLHRENFEFRTLSEETLQWLLSDLRTTLANLRFNAQNTEENSLFLEEFDQFLLKERSLEGMKTLALKLASCFEKKKESNILIATIQEYLKTNYADDSLSLKKISELFSISESYFSYLFKAETGRNFSEYLEEVRMEQAMLLIRNTATPLSELYLHLGYTNPNSFRRAFKKVYGDSPKAFRAS